MIIKNIQDKKKSPPTFGDLQTGDLFIDPSIDRSPVYMKTDRIELAVVYAVYEDEKHFPVGSIRTSGLHYQVIQVTLINEGEFEVVS